MRKDNIIRKMVEALEERMRRDDHPLLLAIWRAKMETLVAIREGETTPERVDANCHDALKRDMDLVSFIKVQSARNAAAWAGGDLETL